MKSEKRAFIILTRTTIVVSNGRYTFYQIHFIKHNLSNTIYPIPFIKYNLSNTIYQIPFFKYLFSNTFFQIQGVPKQADIMNLQLYCYLKIYKHDLNEFALVHTGYFSNG